MRGFLLFGGLMLVACGPTSHGSGPIGPGDGGPVRDAPTLGMVHTGSYNMGPVDFAETVFHNSCAPYPRAIQTLTGNFLAGVDNSLNGDGSLCDACALVTTRLGEKVLLRIVTTGASKAPGNMDLSPQAYDAIYQSDPQGTPDVPRPMSWQLARCADSGPIYLQFQTEANADWTSFWVRNGALPVDAVEVKSSKHASFFFLRREADGTFNDDNGFGAGSFTLRITGPNGAQVTQTFVGFSPGALVETSMQF